MALKEATDVAKRCLCLELLLQRLGLEIDEEDPVAERVVLLWSLSRLGGRPTAAILGVATRLMAEHGVLGDGSIPGAKATLGSVELRPEPELREGLEAYTAARAAPDAVADPDQMVAAIGAQSLSWVLGDSQR
jgi:hypothetical protein